HDEAIKAVKATFLKGIRERNWELAKSGMTDRFQAMFPRPDEGTDVPDNMFRIRQYSGSDLKRLLDKDAFVKVMDEQIGAWTSVDRAVWRSFEFLLEKEENSAFVSAHFQLAGRTKQGRA